MEALSGKGAVVVGGESQHAATLVAALRAAGAAVVVVDRSAELLAPLGGDGRICDMTEAGIADVLGGIEADGHRLDVLVTTPPAIAEAPMASDAGTLDTVLASALRTPFLWTAAAARLMQTRGSGVIVHLTGPSGLGGWRGWEAAGAAFAAVHNVVESFALETAAAGVRVNALVPGVTQRQAELIAAQRDAPLETVSNRIPLGRILPDAALANALLYLVHPSSSYVSGDILVVDGGWSMWGRLHAVAS